jgi:type I restriction enzyme, S subunit
MNELPREWCLAPLMDYVALHDSRRVPLNQTERARRQGPYPYYGANGQVDSIDDFIFDGEFILLAEDGGYFDDPVRGVAYEVSGKFWVNNHAHILSPKNGVPLRYLTYVLNQLDWMPHVGGSTRLKLTQEGMRQIRIPLAPPGERDLIVTKLDSLFNRSKSARKELAHIPRLVERYKQAVLSSVMSADENGRSWPQVPLGELITEGPTNGYSPRSGENPRGTLSLKLTATTRGVMDLSDRAVKRLNEVIPKDSKFWLRPGDILIQRANSLEYVGMAAIYDGPVQKYIYPDLMIRIRVASPTMARWIWRYCLSASGRRYFTSSATGTAGNMPKINGATIRKMPIPLPPVEQLEALLGRVDRALDAIDALQGDAGRAQKLLDRLDQATLAKAFRGELVSSESIPSISLKDQQNVAKTMTKGIRMASW